MTTTLDPWWMADGDFYDDPTPLDLSVFVPPDQLGISKTIVRDPLDKDLIAESQQYFARLKRDAATTPACSHMQTCIDRPGAARDGREGQRDGILELLYLDECGHPGIADA